MNIDVGQVRVGNNRSPVWPENMIGSISHSSYSASAIVGYRNQCLGVGIDIEKIVSQRSLRAIGKMVVHHLFCKFLMA